MRPFDLFLSVYACVGCVSISLCIDNTHAVYIVIDVHVTLKVVHLFCSEIGFGKLNIGAFISGAKVVCTKILQSEIFGN